MNLVPVHIIPTKTGLGERVLCWPDRKPELPSVVNVALKMRVGTHRVVASDIVPRLVQQTDVIGKWLVPLDELGD